MEAVAKSGQGRAQFVPAVLGRRSVIELAKRGGGGCSARLAHGPGSRAAWRDFQHCGSSLLDSGPRSDSPRQER
jgi:hypothetical protein